MLLLLIASCGLPSSGAEWEGDWVIRWARPGEQPYLFTGLLTIGPHANSTETSLSFRETGVTFAPRSVEIGWRGVDLSFDSGMGEFRMALHRDRRGNLSGTAGWVTSDGAVSNASAVDGDRAWEAMIVAGLGLPWPDAAPAEVGLDEAAVRAIVREAQLSNSTGFVLVKDHRLVVAVGREPRKSVEVASVTKAISSLAVPFLLEEKRWPSLDEPLGIVINEWPPGDPRTAITVREVLSHTTGLAKPEYQSWMRHAAADMHRDVVLAPQVVPPSTRFVYNNRAAELTSLLVKRATGEELDDYLRPRLLEPLGIDARWWHDGAGHAMTHAGLRINALDLAKIGATMADDGRWEGAQVLPQGWVQTATGGPASTASRHHGLGWYLVDGGGFQHTGDSGAMLLVIPSRGLVAARVHDVNTADADDRLPQESTGKLIPMVTGLGASP